MSVLLVITNLPDQPAAEKLAQTLVGEGLAACVSILAPCRSVYRWNGVVQNEQEIPVLAKTTSERYAALEAVIRSNHPYELPEIVAVPVERGLAAYLAWVAEESAAT